MNQRKDTGNIKKKEERKKERNKERERGRKRGRKELVQVPFSLSVTLSTRS